MLIFCTNSIFETDYIYYSLSYNEIIFEQFQILPFDQHAAIIYSDLYPKLESIGKIPPDFDLQIASIAIANNLILVTRNTKDFSAISSVLYCST